MRKEAMDFKENKKGYGGKWEGLEGESEEGIIYYNLKKKETIFLKKGFSDKGYFSDNKIICLYYLDLILLT